ncbi:unnamed protein product [Adineta ricciae]|uniref:Uncharacterized protein n=1 Tax=Adineta ricciae TaxID=249248 RepID=A0A813S7T1_ADIRI|nr:unnamed protein product [Adineta ricciae]
MISHPLLQRDIHHSLWLDNAIDNRFTRKHTDHYPFASHDERKTRTVWITNYANDLELDSINVPVDNFLVNMLNTSSTPTATKLESIFSRESNHACLLNKIRQMDLTKLNLDDLLFLLHQLEQQTSKTRLINLASTISSPTDSVSSSSSASDMTECKSSSRNPIHCATIPKLFNNRSKFNHVTSPTQQSNHPSSSSLTVPNIAEAPKHLTCTLVKPILSLHSQTSKHIRSPNDVADKLLQSVHTKYNKSYKKVQ